MACNVTVRWYAMHLWLEGLALRFISKDSWFEGVLDYMVQDKPAVHTPLACMSTYSTHRQAYSLRLDEFCVYRILYPASKGETCLRTFRITFLVM